MSRMKTFFKYAMWIILFFIFSEIMININFRTSLFYNKLASNTRAILYK